VRETYCVIRATVERFPARQKPTATDGVLRDRTPSRAGRRTKNPERSTMTRTPPSETPSRRTLLRWGAAGGAGLALSPLAACAGPTGAPGPGTLTLGLNRSLVSLDNKLNQFDAAVTVQRAVRQALTAIGPDMRLTPVLADRFEMTAPTTWSVRLRDGIRYSDGRPKAPGGAISGK
jgi:peptide/nickel transport system substrate-binding protein